MPVERYARPVSGEIMAAPVAGTEPGEPTLIHAYGATNPAEFFAVVSEVFFERAAEMSWVHPELYRELAHFYRVDPRRWEPA